MLVIDEREAAIVRRVFDAYVSGFGFATIAAELNRDGIPAPYDRTITKSRGRGWAAGTIRAMLTNERYVGRFVWNKRKFVRVPGQKNRRAVERPRSEWRIRECPELAIVSPSVWTVVERRSQRRPGRPLGAPSKTRNRTPQHHLLSGITKCGVCGAGMGVIGQRKKAGVRYVTFGCTGHATRGSAICPNGLTISERKLNAWIFNDLQKKLLAPGAVAYFVDAFNRELAKAAKAPAPTADLDREIAVAERAIANLTDALARVGYSDAIAARLRDEEARLRDLKARRAEIRSAPSVRVLPSPKVVEGYIRNLFESLERDPERARGLLRAHFEQSPLILTPQSEGPDRRFYRATGAFNLWTPELSRYSEIKVAGAGFEPATFGL